jgi:hypothetical protein
MADDFLGPRDCPANITRRTLLGGVAGTALPTPLSASQTSLADPWHHALRAFADARRAEVQFEAVLLRTARRDAEAGELWRLEQRANALSAIRLSKLTELIAVPAVDIEQLAVKLRLAFDHRYRFDDSEGWFAAFLDDARRIVNA